MSIRRLPILCTSLLLAPSLAADSPESYAGKGFAQPFEPPLSSAAIALEVAQLDSNPRPDLLVLTADKELRANRNVAEEGRNELVAEEVDAVAVVRDGGADHVLVSHLGSLFQLTWSGSQGFELNELDGAAAWGGTFLRAVTRDSGAAGALSISGAGVLHLLERVSGSWQLASSFAPTAPETAFHEAELLTWDGSEVVATLGELGVTLHDPATGAPLQAGQTLVPTWSAPPDGAHLAVLDATRNVLGEDLLCWQRAVGDAAPDYDMWLFVMNATRLELLDSDHLDVRQIALVDFLEDGGGAELVLADPTWHAIYFARQDVANLPGPVFELELAPEWLVDLTAIDPDLALPLWIDQPSLVAAGDHDLDGDGANDLALVTPEGTLCVLPGEREGTRERPTVDHVLVPTFDGEGAARTLSYTFVVELPSWATGFQAAVWHRPSSLEPVVGAPLEAPQGAPLPQATYPSSTVLSYPVLVAAPDPGPESGDYESFFLQGRFVDAAGVPGPTLTICWTPQSSSLPVLWDEHAASYVWWGGNDIGDGTVGGPRVKPIGG